MSEAAVAKRRDWLSELRKAEGAADVDGFTDLLTLVAVEAPELRGPGKPDRKGLRRRGLRGGRALGEVGPQDFFSTGTQPSIAPEPKPVAPAAGLKRRKNLTLPASDGWVAKLGLEKLFAAKGPYKTHAKLKAEIEAEQAKPRCQAGGCA